MKINIANEKKELIRAAGRLNASCIELLAALTAIPDEAVCSLSGDEMTEAHNASAAQDFDRMAGYRDRDLIIHLTLLAHDMQTAYLAWEHKTARIIMPPLIDRVSVAKAAELFRGGCGHAED